MNDFFLGFSGIYRSSTYVRALQHTIEIHEFPRKKKKKFNIIMVPQLTTHSFPHKSPTPRGFALPKYTFKLNSITMCTSYTQRFVLTEAFFSGLLLLLVLLVDAVKIGLNLR
jgi:hypothetical protein